MVDVRFVAQLWRAHWGVSRGAEGWWAALRAVARLGRAGCCRTVDVWLEGCGSATARELVFAGRRAAWQRRAIVIRQGWNFVSDVTPSLVEEVIATALPQTSISRRIDCRHSANMPHATLPSPGLQAFILCGPGVSLNTFTSTPSDFPKALVPIANRPMVWYPLDYCYRMGITDITLITPPESAGPLETALARDPALTSLPNPKPEILAPKELMQTTGTGELLRLPEVQKAITDDFVVLPCDIVCELDGARMLEMWMQLNPLALSAKDGKRKGGLSVWYPTYGLEGVSTKKDESDFLATVPLDKPAVPPPAGSLRGDVERIVMNMPTDTLNDRVEEDKGFLRLRQSLIRKHGRVKMRMKYRDAGFYVFPKWVKDFAAANDRFDSLSEDLLGWWAKAGWQGDELAENLSLPEVLGGKVTDEDDMDGELDDTVDPSTLSSTKATAQSVKSTFASRVKSTAGTPKSPIMPPVPPLHAYIHPAPPPSEPVSTTSKPDAVPSSTSAIPLIRRIDTSAQLLTISLYLAKQPPSTTSLSQPQRIHPTASLGQQSRVSEADSLVAENVKFGLRANIKESVIGANCEIGAYSRLTRCLLMEGAVVGEGVTLTGCIIGRRARVEGLKPKAAEGGGETGGTEGEKKKGKGKKAEEDEEERTKLTDCEVAPQFVVEAGTEAKGEKFMAFDDAGGFGDDEDEDEEVGADGEEMEV